MGHAGENMSDLYDKIRQDMQSRREVVGKAGLGFEISVQKAVVGPNGPKIKSKSPLGNGCKCLIQESTWPPRWGGCLSQKLCQSTR
jgi:hypothetical protein